MMMNKKKYGNAFYKILQFAFLFILLFISIDIAMAQQTIKLYDKIPNSKTNPTYVEKSDTGSDGIIRIGDVTEPTITVYHPEASVNAHAAIIICPGGGYKILAYNWEGTSIAETLVKWGITAIVLKYRLPSDSIMIDKTIGPLQDAQRAIQLTRVHAGEWNIDPDKIGIMGFSAGGHLAATASTHFDKAQIDNSGNISLRPDFSVLGYPVISMRMNYTHRGSHDNLLGTHPGEEQENLYSNELRVGKETPPAFLVLAQDDKTVNPENSIMYFQALMKNKIPAELHIYQNGGHGFGKDAGRIGEDWLKRLKHWMEHNHFLHKSNNK